MDKMGSSMSYSDIVIQFDECWRGKFKNCDHVAKTSLHLAIWSVVRMQPAFMPSAILTGFSFHQYCATCILSSHTCLPQVDLAPVSCLSTPTDVDIHDILITRDYL